MIDTNNYYEVLEINPKASPEQIREAYLRTKSIYNSDSAALYSLVGPEEREELIRKIDDAYLVLSDEKKRKEYDLHHGLSESSPQTTPEPDSANVFSIDRVPPMDIVSEASDELLVPPATDFSQQPNRVVQAPTSPPPISTPASTTPAPGAAPIPIAEPETEWSGVTLRQAREARRLSIEEVANYTKISKNYLKAIESEDFSKLPAAVFVRGFVIQISRILKLPSEQVLNQYMKRYYGARPEQAKAM